MEWLTSGETSAAITSYAIRATTGHGRRPGPRPGRHPGRPRPSLQRRLAEAGSGVRAVAAHPGIATTNLTSHIGSIRGKLGRGFKHLFNDEERGALPTLYAATQDVPGACYAGPDGPAHLRGYPRSEHRRKGRGTRISHAGYGSSQFASLRRCTRTTGDAAPRQTRPHAPGSPISAIRRCESLPSTSHSVITLTDRVQTGSADLRGAG